MKDHDEEHEEEEETPCPTCEGSGEIGPFGWEFPEWDTCPDCKGGGLERHWRDPDEEFERRRDFSLE